MNLEKFNALVAQIEASGFVPEKAHAGRDADELGAPVHESFDFDDWCAHHPSLVIPEGTGRGGKYNIPCPWEGRWHGDRPSSCTTLWWDEEGRCLSFHCLHPEHEQYTIHDLVDFLEEQDGEYPWKIFADPDDSWMLDFEKTGIVLEDVTGQAQPGEPEERDAAVNVQDCASQDEEAPPGPKAGLSAAEFYALMAADDARLGREQAARTAEESASPPKPAAIPNEPASPGSGSSKEMDEAIANQPWRRYPECAFPYHQVCRPGSLLKELVDGACTGVDGTPLELDPGLVIEALLTIVTALPREDKMLGTRINRFSVLLTASRSGKGKSWEHAVAMLGLTGSNAVQAYNPVGHSQMIQQLGDTQDRKTKENPNPKVNPGPKRMCWWTPELAGVLKQARSEGSKILEQGCEFCDENAHYTKDRYTGRKVKMDCRLSWVMALPVGDKAIDERKFSATFNANANDGFAGRLCLGFSEKLHTDWRKFEEWTPKPIVVEHPVTLEPGDEYEGLPVDMEPLAKKYEHHVVKGYAPGVREKYMKFSLGEDSFGGDTFLLKKTMLAIAIANLHELITDEDFEAAAAWLRWQVELRKIFHPSRADEQTQAKFQETVVRAMRREDQRMAKAGKAITDREINVSRLAQRNEWSQRGTTLGLPKTMDALRNCGAFLPTRESWKKGLAWHWTDGKCWCGEGHPPTLAEEYKAAIARIKKEEVEKHLEGGDDSQESEKVVKFGKKRAWQTN